MGTVEPVIARSPKTEKGLKSKSSQALPHHSSEPTGRAPRRSSGDIVLFAKDCIFCNKVGRIEKKKYGKSISENTSVFDMGEEKTIQKIAEEKGDEELLTRITGKRLFSVEAHYHAACRKQYIRSAGLRKSEDEEEIQKQLNLEAHSQAFEKVCFLVQEKGVQQSEIVKLDEFTRYYDALLE